MSGNPTNAAAGLWDPDSSSTAETPSGRPSLPTAQQQMDIYVLEDGEDRDAEDLIAVTPNQKSKDKGPAPEPTVLPASSPSQHVLARTAGGIVPVGPGLVVASSIPDLDEDSGDWAHRAGAASASNRPARTLAIFVVRFDTKHGNMVEWSYPEGVDVSGVEFSCLPAGSHNIHEDVMWVSLSLATLGPTSH